MNLVGKTNTLIFLTFFLVVFIGFYVSTAFQLFADTSYELLQNESLLLSGPFASVKTAEELYGLKRSKEVIAVVFLSCFFHCSQSYILLLNLKNGFDCSPEVIRISDQASLEEDETRPQILISGEIHGDERVVSCTLAISFYLFHVV